MAIQRMTWFNRASPALVEILNKLDRSETPTDVDQDIYEHGSVRYHVQASASDPQIVYLSISTPPLSPEASLSPGLPECTMRDIKSTYSDYAEIVEPPRTGFLLTLRLNFAKISHRKEKRVKAIAEISSLLAVIMTSQLKDMLWSLGSKDMDYGTYKPVKLVYHPREPFFVFRLPEKITVIFPMRFKEDSDVVLATSFFQELMDAGCSAACAKAPRCIWSPIPPPELRGEAFQHLATNGGFVSFGSSCVNKLKTLSKSMALKRKYATLVSNSIKRIHSRIRIKGLDRFRRRWFKIPKFNSLRKYTKLE
ncbi:actin-related protein 2/3 complex subunit 2B isoform X2 [Asparagus officinalis]|uniref:actin-related protein 2/3 complex subunit 2B isoform X2 n=1 Tax=Asparagus officinalis TaxID=4686 RepID=UPI00098E7F76|nr:actin-related protein 2/3 complex subunit 2B isoform X2 [Asparagus officinalis]